MRDDVLAALGPDERIVAVWSTRGIGANALVCTSTRALTAKRTELIRWSVAAFPYPEIASVEVIEGPCRGFAPNTVMFRGTRRAREAAETLRELTAEHRRP